MDCDVVVAGAGIGGSALATVLARAGLTVLVLEKDTEYRDRVRGEWMAPWGVVESKRLGLYDTLRAGGGHHVSQHRSYHDVLDAVSNPLNTVDLRGVVPDVPGPLCLGHPRMCSILSEAAEAAGATVLRGVDKIELGALSNGGASARREVRYEHAGAQHTVRCRLVVGADGRGSGIRKQAGIALHRDPTHHLFAGLLVEGADAWPEGLQVTGVEGDSHFLVFPQGGGRARLYLGYALEQHKRLTGPDAAARFLDAFRLACLPEAAVLAGARPAGPCHSYGNEDSWTDSPVADGVVLIGDAAGHNDPIIGQGLSITLRDVRIVRDILLAGGDWSPAAFEPYTEERRERMRRLRFAAALAATLENEFGPDAAARRERARELQLADPTLMLWFLSAFVGPDALPATAFEASVRERLLAPA
jgi:2-polyprenyl-6-methoxyphenol hydroxylase-like FAD-dependent oxidoreductase